MGKKPQQPQRRLCSCGKPAIVVLNTNWMCTECFDKQFGSMTRSLSQVVSNHFGMKILNPPKGDDNVEESTTDQS